MAYLALVPIYVSEQRKLLAPLVERLERRFPLAVKLHPPWFDPEEAFDPSRGQYDSRGLLAALLGKPVADAERVLGVTSVDLFVPVLSYVFGEAQLGGRAALVSVHRLRNEVYGLPGDDVVLLERLEKEAVHELGHTYGLVHCREIGCVMLSSTYAEEIDFKGAAFCPACLDSRHRTRGRDESPMDGNGP